MRKLFISGALVIALQAIKIKDDLPYADEDDNSLPGLAELLGVDEKESVQAASKTELDGSTVESSGNADIDDIAANFVDGDESLNAQIEAESKYKPPVKSGYPYED